MRRNSARSPGTRCLVGYLAGIQLSAAQGITEHFLTYLVGSLSASDYNVFVERVQLYGKCYTGPHVVPTSGWPASYSEKSIQRRQGRAKTALLRIAPFVLEGLISDDQMRVLRLLVEIDYEKTLAEFSPEEVDALEQKIFNL